MPKAASKPPIRAVCMGRVRETRSSDWRPAIMMLTDIGTSSVARIVLMDGTPLETVWDYEREEWLGMFAVPEPVKAIKRKRTQAP